MMWVLVVLCIWIGFLDLDSRLKPVLLYFSISTQMSGPGFLVILLVLVSFFLLLSFRASQFSITIYAERDSRGAVIFTTYNSPFYLLRRVEIDKACWKNYSSAIHNIQYNYITFHFTQDILRL